MSRDQEFCVIFWFNSGTHKRRSNLGTSMTSSRRLKAEHTRTLRWRQMPASSGRSSRRFGRCCGRLCVPSGTRHQCPVTAPRHSSTHSRRVSRSMHGRRSSQSPSGRIETAVNIGIVAMHLLMRFRRSPEKVPATFPKSPATFPKRSATFPKALQHFYKAPQHFRKAQQHF